MIQVKTFILRSHNELHHEKLDNQINTFLIENDVKVIDIKYSSSITGEGACHMSAMLIFDEQK